MPASWNLATIAEQQLRPPVPRHIAVNLKGTFSIHCSRSGPSPCVETAAEVVPTSPRAHHLAAAAKTLRRSYAATRRRVDGHDPHSRQELRAGNITVTLSAPPRADSEQALLDGKPQELIVAPSPKLCAAGKTSSAQPRRISPDVVWPSSQPGRRLINGKTLARQMAGTL